MRLTREWTKKDISVLYECASRTTLRHAAKRLGRSYSSVANKSSRLGIRWNQGSWRAADIAREVGCSIGSVTRLIAVLFDPAHVLLRYSGASRRYCLDSEQAARLVTVLQATRKRRARNIKAGKAAAQKRERERRAGNQKEIYA